MLCFRLLESDNPELDLQNTVSSLTDGAPASNVFSVTPSSFQKIPTAPFAYWTPPALIDAFSTLESIDTLFEARLGMQTNDDAWMVRLWTEIPPESFGQIWAAYSKGGSYSPYYADVHLCVLWDSGGRTIRAKIVGDGDAESRYLRSQEFYGTPGLNWPRRTTSGISVRPLPKGTIFGEKSPTLFAGEKQRLAMLALMNSRTFTAVIRTQLAAATAAARSYEVGIIQRSVIPDLADPRTSELAESAKQAWALKRFDDTFDSCSHAFCSPALLSSKHGLSESTDTLIERKEEVQTELQKIQSEIDQLSHELYGFAKGQPEPSTLQDEAQDTSVSVDTTALTAELVDYFLGLALGRWDIRYATGERQPPELPDPFDPLPVCPPGMLQNADGLPAAPSDVPDDYPLPITWPGILVSDPGHPEDIVARVRDALAVIWGDRSAAIEQEACEILGVRTLRDYFAEKKSGGKFFKDHLKRYSKSRRQAPIYWPLSTESGAYTLWIYYHRLDSDTLWRAVSDFVEPKIEGVSRDLQRLTAKGDQRTATENKEWEKLTDLSGELQVFRDELLRIANLPWKPNLNDGVQITAAPLWSLFRLKAWQKKLKDTWTKLEGKKGEYDWANLAHTLWPNRVIPKCTTDRSLAIAHGYEDDLWEEVTDDRGKTKWQPKKGADEIADRLIKETKN